MAMNFHDCCVDHCVFHVGLIAKRVEYPFEYIGLNPATEPPEGTVPVPEFPGQVAPWRICPHDPQHGFKEKPRIAACAARRRDPARAQGFNQKPLSVREDKSAPVHSNLLFWRVEAELIRFGNPECPQTLG